MRVLLFAFVRVCVLSLKLAGDLSLSVFVSSAFYCRLAASMFVDCVSLTLVLRHDILA